MEIVTACVISSGVRNGSKRYEHIIGYLSKETGKQWINETREISAMLVGLIKSKGRGQD